MLNKTKLKHTAIETAIFLKNSDDKPDYDNIHGPLGKWIDDIFLSQFRTKMAEKVCKSSFNTIKYDDVIQVTKKRSFRITFSSVSTPT
jgi:hypothetical protein